MIKVNKDCRHYNGYKPCTFHKKERVECENCPHYDKIGYKILIINLEAVGDVIRTTSLLKPLKDKYRDCHITWLTTLKSVELLKKIDLIDRVTVFNLESSLRLQIEHFDFLINLEKDFGVAALASLIDAEKKAGFGLDKSGNLYPFNKEAEYFLEIGISDRLKKASRKTQQEIIFDIAGLKYNKDRSIFPIFKAADDFAEEFLRKHSIKNRDLIIGFNTGCSTRLFLDRKWTIKGFIELAKLLYEKYKAKILLFGGKNEIERNKEIKDDSLVPVIDTGSGNTLEQLGALIGKCHILVSGDTMAVHIAAALNVPVIALFGCVSPHEIEIYENGSKIVTDMDCACCYKYKCEFDETCMDLIDAKQVFSEIEKLLKRKGITGG